MFWWAYHNGALYKHNLYTNTCVYKMKWNICTFETNQMRSSFVSWFGEVLQFWIEKLISHQYAIEGFFTKSSGVYLIYFIAKSVVRFLHTYQHLVVFLHLPQHRHRCLWGWKQNPLGFPQPGHKLGWPMILVGGGKGHLT